MNGKINFKMDRQSFQYIFS